MQDFFPRPWWRLLVLLGLLFQTAPALRAADAIGPLTLRPATVEVSAPGSFPFAMNGVEMDSALREIEGRTPTFQEALPITAGGPAVTAWSFERALGATDSFRDYALGEVAPVPETSTWVAAALVALFLFGFRLQRKIASRKLRERLGALA